MRAATSLLLLAVVVSTSAEALSQSRFKNLTEEEAAKLWLEEIASYTITKSERDVFESLTASEDRVRFIDAFWRRRDPTPETPENEYRIEHYRRLAYVNRFFGAGRPGWRTDRGRIYILLGPPDVIDSDPMGRQMHQYPTEVWIYRRPAHPQLPPNMEIAFVDTRLTGEYELTFNLLKDADATRQMEALLGENYHEATTLQEMRAWNFGRTGTVHYGDGMLPELERLDELALMSQIPELQLRPLREEVTARVSFATGSLSVEREVDRYRGSDGALALAVTLRLPYKDFSYAEEPSRYESRLDLLARLVGPGGESVDEVSRQEVVAVPREQFEATRAGSLIYQLFLQAPPGSYELQLAVRDNGTNSIRTTGEQVMLPDLGGELVLSSVVLADRVDKLEVPVPRGREPFSHGEYRVLPNVERLFPAGGTLHLYFEVYNLAPGEEAVTSLAIDYLFRREGRLFRKVPTTYPYPTDRRDRSVVSAIPLKDFEPGRYSLTVQVTDRIASRTASADIPFEVR